MAIKITNIETDLPKLNIELSKFDLHQTQLKELRSQLGQLQQHILNSDAQLAAKNYLTHNNLVFTWTGGTLTLSWANGYVFSNGHYLPVPAGSRVLTASTYYWMAWNPLQQSMSSVTNLGSILSLPSAKNIITLCQLYTGTGAQTGSAGGGGTEPGGAIGVNGKQYKNF